MSKEKDKKKKFESEKLKEAVHATRSFMQDQVEKLVPDYNDSEKITFMSNFTINLVGNITFSMIRNDAPLEVYIEQSDTIIHGLKKWCSLNMLEKVKDRINDDDKEDDSDESSDEHQCPKCA